MSPARGLVVLPVAMALALAGCGQRAPVEPTDTSEWWEIPPERGIPADIWPAVQEVVEAGNRFALDLYANVRDNDGNLFLSPFSISTALSMTYAGAETQTESEMADILHVSGDESEWHAAYGAYLASLNRGAGLGGYEFSTANRLWGQEDYSFLDSFLGVTRDHYEAEMGRLDFARDPEGSRLTINEWVSEQTREKIDELLQQGSVTDLTRLVLTNAIYFKSTWFWQFDPDVTEDYEFWLGPSQAVTVPLMQGEAEFGYAAFDNLQVLAMPYASQDVSMVVLLPRSRDGLPQLEAELTYESLESWIASLEKTDVIVGFPRFSVRWRKGLNETLADMGMPSAFSLLQADFSGMTGLRDLYIGLVIHEAYADVNEEGTEAAAATAVVMWEIVSDPEDPAPPLFVADHPFLFLIYDHVTGGILFMGRVVNPLEGGD